MPTSSRSPTSTTPLSDRGGEPLYRQIYEHYRRQIVAGRLKKNALLPSEQEIVDTLGVSRITVRRALNELAASGLVTRQRGRGTIVSYNAAAPTIRASFDQLIEGLTRMGIETEVRLLSCTLVQPSTELRSVMELGRGEKLQRVIRLRLLDGEPFSYLETHIPEHVAKGYDETELASASLIELLDRTGHRPVSATQTITAVAAGGAAATHLALAPGMPLLRVHRLMRDEAEKIVQDITAHYRGDRYQYHMNLLRQADARWSAGD